MATRYSLSKKHALSVFKNSCLSSPSSTTTSKRPTSAPGNLSPTFAKSTPNKNNRREKPSDRSFERRQRLQSSRVATSKPTPSNPPGLTAKSVSHVQEPAGHYETLFHTLLENNSLLHKEVSRLKKKHKKTLSKLSLYSQEKICETDRNSGTDYAKDKISPRKSASRPGADLEMSHRTGNVTVKPTGTHRPTQTSLKRDTNVYVEEYDDSNEGDRSAQYDTPEEFHTDVDSERSYSVSNSDNRDGDDLTTNSLGSYKITYISSPSSSEETAGEGNVSVKASCYSSPGMLAVGRMWENFSVEDFSQTFPSDSVQGSKIRGTRSEMCAPPKVTTPKPFSMTLRESNTIKKKTRSMIIAEHECDERKAQEETECYKEFRANPMPASTLLPLYELINAKNEQRRSVVKKISINLLKSSQKPFNFSKREEEKRRQKSGMLKQVEECERLKIKERAFRARPMPVKLFDPEVEAGALEKEEYRKIRIQIRAEKLLADASSSHTVRLATAKKRSGSNHTRPRLSRDCSFHPRITHRIPDYNRAYSKFQQELALKKQSKLTTVSEPFLLHTERRANGCQNKQPPKGILKQYHPQKEVKNFCTSSPAYLPQMTKTAKQRLLLTQERLAKVEQKEVMAEEEIKAKKRREKNVQKLVAQRSSILDLSDMLDDKKRMKIEEFRYIL